MRTIRDRNCLLGEGLALIRQQFQLPSVFPPDAEAEAALDNRRRDFFAAGRFVDLLD